MSSATILIKEYPFPFETSVACLYKSQRGRARQSCTEVICYLNSGLGVAGQASRGYIPPLFQG